MTERPVVLVTGASRGIGRATVHRLRKDGYEPIGVARSKPADLGPGELFEECDLGDPGAVEDLVERVSALGPVYGLVNNAAMSPTTSMPDTTPADMDAAYRISVLAPLALAQGLLSGMRGLGAGRIINMSSRAALGKVNRTAYGAAKSALVGMTHTWALELAGDGITVNAISPGPVDTELFRTASPADDPKTIALKASIPVQRIGAVDEVAHVVAFLLHDLAGYITGQTIYIDGGLTVGRAR
jgi:3-oxoacyl-[acyl-carrier protein] reductase